MDTGRCCAACEKPIYGAVLEIDDGRFFHPTCFVCSQCTNVIDGDFMKLDGHQLCFACTPKNHCKACNQVIDGDFVEVRHGEKYHANCLRCAQCSRGLDGTVFRDGERMVCGQCIDKQELGSSIAGAHHDVIDASATSAVKLNKQVDMEPPSSGAGKHLAHENTTSALKSSGAVAKKSLQGFLHRRRPGVLGKLLRHWDSQYVVVDELKVKWWANKEDCLSGKPCSGFIGLDRDPLDIRASSWRASKFYMAPRNDGCNGRRFQFDVSASEHSRDAWMKAILEQLRLALKADDAVGLHTAEGQHTDGSLPVQTKPTAQANDAEGRKAVNRCTTAQPAMKPALVQSVQDNSAPPTQQTAPIKKAVTFAPPAAPTLLVNSGKSPVGSPAKFDAGNAGERNRRPSMKNISSLKGTKSLWENFAKQNEELQKQNPWSPRFSGEKRALKKGDEGYGRATPGSKTEERAQKAQQWVEEEITKLLSVIQQSGHVNANGDIAVSFGKLFLTYQDISDTLVGIMARAKKRGLIAYPGDMLWQGADDAVEVVLVTRHNNI